MKQYFNRAQEEILSLSPHDLILIAGRAFGKGAVQAGRLQQAFQGMEGSCGGFVAPSVKRCLTNILPSMLIHLERWGFKRDIHYCVGKRPWKALHWKSPVFTPDNWENTISFYNGSVCSIISQDRKGTSNSMSLDYLIIDEARFINPDQLRNETLPANRGNVQFFGKHYMHHGLTITSDMGQSKKTRWFTKYAKDAADAKNAQLLIDLATKVNDIAAVKRWLTDYPNDIMAKKLLDDLRKERDALRKAGVLFCVRTSFDNLDLLGEDFFRQLKRDLPKSLFETSVLSIEQRISRDGFYNGLDEDNNYYTAPNTSYLDNMEYDFQKLQQCDCRMDADVDPNQPLIIAFDANSNFNCMVVGQVVSGVLRVIKSFYTKYERHLEELVGDFCDYYKPRKDKRVIFYYDHTFKGATTGKRTDELHVRIETALFSNHWLCTPCYIGRAMGHVDKGILINRMLQGKDALRVIINRDNNQDLIVALESAETINNKKNKSGEKEVETEETPLEHRTDFTDAFDTLLIGCHSFPKFMAASGFTSSIQIRG